MVTSVLHIPEEMKDARQWTLWRKRRNPKTGKWSKPPVDYRTGRFAKKDAPLLAYSEAVEAHRKGGHKADGVGFVLPAGLAGIDLDDAVAPSGELLPFAQTIVELFEGVGFVEFSPSDRGLHIITKGKPYIEKSSAYWDNVKGLRKVEVYAGADIATDGKRHYLTVTGDLVGPEYESIGDGQVALANLNALLPQKATEDSTAPRPAPQAVTASTVSPNGNNAPGTLTDADVIEKAGAAANGDKFRALWQGDVLTHPSASEAHMALANILAFYAADVDQLLRLLTQAPVKHDKWEREDYLATMTKKAWARVKTHYDPNYRSAPTNGGGNSPGGSNEEPPPLTQEEVDALAEHKGSVETPQETHPDEAPGKVPRFVMYGPEHYLQPPPPIEWTVENVIVVGSMAMVVGESGSGKTYVCMDMAACVATGNPWLGKATKQGKVIILDEENGLNRMHRRLHEVVNGHFGDDSTPLYFSTYNGLNMLDNEEEQRLYDLIDEHKPAMIIIDSLADIIPGADENSVKDVHRPLHKLHRMATFTGTSIVVIHHMNKGGSYRGSSTIKADVDTMLTVERKEESPFINFSFEKLRDGNPVKFAAEAHWTDGQFWLTEAEIQEDKPIFTKGQKHVLQYLAEHGASNVNDIKDAAEICAPRTAKDAVYTLANVGLVYRTNTGAADKDGAVYSLTTEGKDAAETL